jgi:hypothetical protein
MNHAAILIKREDTKTRRKKEPENKITQISQIGPASVKSAQSLFSLLLPFLRVFAVKKHYFRA